jgi:hypothetical protein
MTIPLVVLRRSGERLPRSHDMGVMEMSCHEDIDAGIGDRRPCPRMETAC